MSYLSMARKLYPGVGDGALAQQGQAVCQGLRVNPSLHDRVGQLAGELGNKGAADQFVRSAVKAYCPEMPTR